MNEGIKMYDLNIGITYESGWSNTPHYLTEKVYWLLFNFQKLTECKDSIFLKFNILKMILFWSQSELKKNIRLIYNLKKK